MPFLPLKSSVRTLNIPTTNSPALDLDFASTRSFRAALRFLRCLLLFFRAAYFLCTVLRFSHAVVCFLRSILLYQFRFLPRFQRAGGSSPNSPRRPSPLLPDTDLGAYSRGSYPLFSVRYEFHDFRDGDTTQLPQAKLARRKNPRGIFRRVAEHHRRLGHSRALVRRASTVAVTLPWELRHVLGRPQAQDPREQPKCIICSAGYVELSY